VLDSGHEHIAGGETAVGNAARVKLMRVIAVASLVARNFAIASLNSAS